MKSAEVDNKSTLKNITLIIEVKITTQIKFHLEKVHVRFFFFS